MNEKESIFVFTTAYRPFVGGAEVAIEETVSRLGDSFDFVIFTARMDARLPNTEASGSVTIARIGPGWGRADKIILPLLIPFAVRRFYKIYKPRAFWGVMVSYASIGALLFRFFHPRVSFLLTLQEGNREWEWKKNPLAAFWWRIMLRNADSLAAISGFLKSLGLEFGYQGRDSRVIPNGVDLDGFRRLRGAKEELREKWGIPKDSFAVLTISRLVEKNGVDTLIHSIQKLPEEISEKTAVLIAGKGHLEKKLKAEAEKSPGGSRILFFGELNRDELAELCQASDVHVRASRSEGMGNVFIEALAAGIPVIGTPVGGIPDIIEDGITGLFVPPDDPTKLAEAIEKLYRNPKLRDSIVENGRRMIRGRFTWEIIAESYKDLFDKLLSPKVLIATGLFPPEIGGPATYSKMLMDNLPDQGIYPQLLAFAEVRPLPKILRHAVFFLKALKKGWRCDAIFAQDPVSVGVPSAMAAKILRRPLVLKVVGDYAWEQGVSRFGVSGALDEFLKIKQKLRVHFFQKLERWTALSAEKIIVPSRYLKRVVAAWNVPEKKIEVVYNALEEMPALPSKAAARAELGYQGFVIVSAGRLVPWKGFSGLLDVLPELIPSYPLLRVKIIGSGPDREKLLNKINSLSLEKVVELIPSLPRERFLLHLFAADLFLLNTGYEGLPHVILEALSVGTPVITTDVGGNPEVIKDGVNGRLVACGDKESLKGAILSVLLNPGLPAAWARAGRETLDGFSSEKLFQETGEHIIKSISQYGR